jgi:hypothetical protein
MKRPHDEIVEQNEVAVASTTSTTAPAKHEGYYVYNEECRRVSWSNDAQLDKLMMASKFDVKAYPFSPTKFSGRTIDRMPGLVAYTVWESYSIYAKMRNKTGASFLVDCLGFPVKNLRCQVAGPVIVTNAVGYPPFTERLFSVFGLTKYYLEESDIYCTGDYDDFAACGAKLASILAKTAKAEDEAIPSPCKKQRT